MRARSVLVAPMFTLVLASCGGRSHDASAPAATTASRGDAGTAGDGGAVERPFAGSAAEATSLISQAIDKRGDAVAKCVREYRVRKQLTRERVEVSVGIDQEGHLLGVTLPKGKKDEALSSCVMDALRSATFPRSHAGVITMSKSYEEVVQ